MNEIPKAVFTKKGYHPKTEDFATIPELPAYSSWMNARVLMQVSLKELKN
jgi:hypothetical protein